MYKKKTLTSIPLTESWIYFALMKSENHQLASNTCVSSCRFSGPLFLHQRSGLGSGRVLDVRTVMDGVGVAQWFCRQGEARLRSGIRMLNSHTDPQREAPPETSAQHILHNVKHFADFLHCSWTALRIFVVCFENVPYIYFSIYVYLDG